VLVVSVTEAALVSTNATSTIPIVMVGVQDPVAAGLVASPARPGSNVTGLSRETRDLVGKTLQLLKEALPEAARVDLLASPTDPSSATMVRDAKEGAKLLGAQLKIVQAQAPAELDGAFSTMHADRADALLVVGGVGFYLSRGQIVDLALRKRLPSAFQSREFVEARGLLSLCTEHRCRLPARSVLRGQDTERGETRRPAGGATHQVRVGHQLRDRQALGLTIPPSMLGRADEVIQ
jgi:putative ABC transport system substrate-binding protein